MCPWGFRRIVACSFLGFLGWTLIVRGVRDRLGLAWLSLSFWSYFLRCPLDFYSLASYDVAQMSLSFEIRSDVALIQMCHSKRTASHRNLYGLHCFRSLSCNHVREVRLMVSHSEVIDWWPLLPSPLFRSARYGFQSYFHPGLVFFTSTSRPTIQKTSCMNSTMLGARSADWSAAYFWACSLLPSLS